MAKGTAIVVFQNDLRLLDNPALKAACAYEHVVPIYIWAPESEAPWSPGTASRWWLHGSLQSLQESLKKQGTRLQIFKGEDFVKTLKKAADQIKPAAIYWNRRYEPVTRTLDVKLKKTFPGIHLQSFKASLLTDPGEVLKKDGTCYQVFTPFWKAFIKSKVPMKPQPAPTRIPGLPAIAKTLKALTVDDLKLRPGASPFIDIAEVWSPGEITANKILKNFIKNTITGYDQSRNIPGVQGTSRMSAHLHFGEISPRTIWQAVVEKYGPVTKIRNKNIVQFLKEIVWREFAYQMLWYYPATDKKSMRSEFSKFPWRKNKRMKVIWQIGMTGFPIVDAGMRELLRTGWMHNRVRMVVASFLIKDLLIPWQEGAAWFWETLVDADLANNTLGWQWTAGCGADAAPFFRVFNPVLQGKKFDPKGKYIRKYVPELSGLADKYLFGPWEAPPEVLKTAGVILGKTYPKPMVDHSEAKLMALKSYEKMKREKS